MDLSKLTPKFKNKKPKRVGRGCGSGLGKTSTRGNKGAGQRSGKKLPYIGFNGGNIPYIRKIPKRGFVSFSKKYYQVVNLGRIAQKVSPVEEITPKVLKHLNLIKDENKPVKILGVMDGRFPFKTIFKADSFSKKATELIIESGCNFEILKRT
ncbi:MAG: 50S ribosomal protein L15 [Candidatus Omnitrophica bacterium]|nr:50S ribosomal protein L15 [Candidatus Omnitrophota bacterium]